MSRNKNRPRTTVRSSDVAAKVAAVAAGVGFTREKALAIAAAEPRGATIFAGSLKPMADSKRRPSIPSVSTEPAAKTVRPHKALKEC